MVLQGNENMIFVKNKVNKIVGINFDAEFEANLKTILESN